VTGKRTGLRLKITPLNLFKEDILNKISTLKKAKYNTVSFCGLVNMPKKFLLVGLLHKKRKFSK